MTNPLWQLYDEQGRAIAGKGRGKDEVYGKALLHGASHVWIWRLADKGVEILLQKRAPDKRTWPSRYDISAAGHIDLGEDALTAAIRETQEEIGHSVNEVTLQFIGAHRCYVVGPDNTWTENEIRFLYLLQATPDLSFSFDDGEVESVEWKLLDNIKQVATDTAQTSYVPHGEVYFNILFEALANPLFLGNTLKANAA